MFSLIITTAYRSSMVAHMTVQGMSQPLETFEDLVKQDGWRWGTEPWLLSGVLSDYFSKHTDPVIHQIYKKMEVSHHKVFYVASLCDNLSVLLKV